MLNKLFCLTACGSVAYSYCLYMILLNQSLYFCGRLSRFIMRRMWVNGLIMQQRPLLVQTHYLAAGAESRINTQNGFLTQWRSH